MSKLHHVAYRCSDARETTEFYSELLGFPLVMSLVQEDVPSIKKSEPHIHIFFRMSDGSFVAFFDTLGDTPPLGSLEGDWAQHLAIDMEDQASVEPILSRLEAAGVEVVGPVNHGICNSYYFRDPSGHRLEIAVPTEDADRIFEEEQSEADDILDQWMARKEASRASS